MQIQSHQFNSYLSQKKNQNPTFTAIPNLKSLSRKEVDLLADELGSTTSRVKILQGKIGEFLCEEGQKGRKLLDGIFGKQEKVIISFDKSNFKINGDTETIKLPVDGDTPIKKILENIGTKLKKTF